MTDSRTVPLLELESPRWQVNLDRLMAGVIAGAICGAILLGVGARVAMRLVALIVGQTPEFTVLGSAVIVLMATVVGVFFGAIFAAIARVIVLPSPWRGVHYGAVLSLVFVTPLFLFGGEGELALLPAWAGLTLFGMLPVAYGTALDVAYLWMARRLHNSRTLHIFWLLAFAALLLTTAFVLIGIAGTSLRAPAAVHELLGSSNVSFSQTQNSLRFLGLVFVLTYCGLCLGIFWLGCASHTLRICTMLLLVAALGLFVPAGTGLPFADMNVPTARTIGLAALLAILVLIPDARHVRRTSWIAGVTAWTALAAALIAGPAPLLQWSCWLVATAGLLVVIARKIMDQTGKDRPLLRGTSSWSMIAATAATVLLLGTWAAILCVPALWLPGTTALITAFAVVPYWFPWLLLPGLVYLATRSDTV